MEVKELMACKDDIDRFLKEYNPDEILWSPKLDGVRCAAIPGKYQSRNGKFYKNFNCFDDALGELARILGIPYGFFDGEVISNDKSFDKLSTQLHRKYGVDDSILQFKIFDVLIPEPLHKRLSELNRAFLSLPQIYHSRLSFLYHHHSPEICKSRRSIETLCNTLVLKGFEGAVLKYANGYYEHKRSLQWLKVKQFKTLDLKVTGRYEGTGKYAGMLGGIFCVYKGVTSRIGGGYSDVQRKAWWDCPEAELPGIIEVKFQEITKANKLRFADFVCVRNDKNEVDG